MIEALKRAMKKKEDEAGKPAKAKPAKTLPAKAPAKGKPLPAKPKAEQVAEVLAEWKAGAQARQAAMAASDLVVAKFKAKLAADSAKPKPKAKADDGWHPRQSIHYRTR